MPVPGADLPPLSAATRRVLFSMTIDPDGAMDDWVDPPAGWEVVPLPTQEAIHLVGVSAYQELVVDACAREGAALLVTHPPYDYLDPAVAARIRAGGTRLLAYAFDDEIFAAGYGAATWEALRRIYDRYVTTREVPWATAPRPAIPTRSPTVDVALVGRAYARRRALVAALEGAGFSVAVAGHGWPRGFLARGAMEALYGTARIVLSTADWEGHAVPMVKHRLLDTALLGVFQIAQWAPDLAGYFPETEVPSYRSIDELIDLVGRFVADAPARHAAAAAARARALREHTWARRFDSLIAGLELAPPTVAPVGAARRGQLDLLLAALASRAESDGRLGAAAALQRRLLDRRPDDATALGAWGRLRRELGDPEAALPCLRAAAASRWPAAAAAVDGAIPAFGVGTGLGRLGLLPPAAEPIVFQVAALCDLERFAEAAALLDGIADPRLARVVGRTIALDEGADRELAAAVGRAATRAG